MAWAITTGNENIRIGILDNGIDHDHDDLTDNIWRDGQGNVMGGDFTSDGFSTGRPYGNESHGTHCAGLAAAPINDEGIVGVAPEVSLVPLKIATGQTGTARSWQFDETGFINALDYAIDNDIDVLSASFGRSWGGVTSILDQAFEDIIDDGRDGKGIVFVTSSGNSGSDWDQNDDISYRDEVITVGGTNKQDQRWPNSSYEPSLNFIVDIAAPTGWAESDGVSNYTTDIKGSDGETSGDYTPYFGGTSGATPVVAGAAALLLSMDNQLTHQEVKDLLYDSAEKVGGYSYIFFGKSAEIGHGRLNTFDALKNVMPNQYTSQSFTSSTTLPDLSRIGGSTSLSAGVILTISADDFSVIEGNINGSSGSTLTINGKLVISASASLDDIDLNIGSNGELIIQNGASVSDSEIDISGEFDIRENTDLTNIDIDVASGGELIINEGATLIFASGQGIEADGVVTMAGSSGNEITLSASGGSAWNGVELYENDSSLRFVTIEDAVNGVTSYNLSGLVIQNVEVFGSTWDGFRFVNTSTASPAGGFGYFRADGNGIYGVYYDGASNDELVNSIMVDNPSSGLIITGGASLEGVVNSRIYNGGTNGLRADNSSYLEINASSIHGNSYRDAFANNSTISATGNWWGTSSPSASQFEEISGGSIDYSNALFFDPLPGSFQKRVASARLHSETHAPEKAATEINSVAGLRKALSGFKGAEALGELQRLSAAGLSPELTQWSKVIRVELHQRMKNHSQAIETGNGILSGQNISPEVRKTMARRLFYSYVLGTRDFTSAKAMLANLEQWDEEESELNQLSWLLERHGKDAIPGDDKESLKKVAQSADIQLSNYPNPFNPVTTIQYRLEQPAQVSLRVFDSLGRQVANLVNEQQSTGQYSVPFDASRLSSGIYLYRLTMGTTVISKTMTLVK